MKRGRGKRLGKCTSLVRWDYSPFPFSSKPGRSAHFSQIKVGIISEQRQVSVTLETRPLRPLIGCLGLLDALGSALYQLYCTETRALCT